MSFEIGDAPTLDQILNAEQLAELAEYTEACEYYTEHDAQWNFERGMYGDATFTRPTPPAKPEWWDEKEMELDALRQAHEDRLTELYTGMTIAELDELPDPYIPF